MKNIIVFFSILVGTATFAQVGNELNDEEFRLSFNRLLNGLYNTMEDDRYSFNVYSKGKDLYIEIECSLYLSNSQILSNSTKNLTESNIYTAAEVLTKAASNKSVIATLWESGLYSNIFFDVYIVKEDLSRHKMAYYVKMYHLYNISKYMNKSDFYAILEP